MTQEQLAHAELLIEELSKKLLTKYEKGASEHGGNLWEKKPEWMLEQAIDEAIDQVVYLLTLQQQLYGGESV